VCVCVCLVQMLISCYNVRTQFTHAFVLIHINILAMATSEFLRSARHHTSLRQFDRPPEIRYSYRKTQPPIAYIRTNGKGTNILYVCDYMTTMSCERANHIDEICAQKAAVFIRFV
jgi:hypothetical protein